MPDAERPRENKRWQLRVGERMRSGEGLEAVLDADSINSGERGNLIFGGRKKI
jgi:hypothetical protein